MDTKPMDPKQKKQLLEEYKNRHPELGVIVFLCKERVN